MGIFDVPATDLIDCIAADLKGKIKQPAWMDFAKTGRHRERAPHRRDWFYVRMASILYRVYKEGILGTNRLRTYYGGRKNRGVQPHKVFRAGGKVIRVCLQELEKQGLLEKAKAGRKVSGKGASYLNAKAKEVKKRIDEEKAKAPKPKPIEKPKPIQEKPVEKPKEEAKIAEKPKQEIKGEAKPEAVEKAGEMKEKPAEKEKVENKKENEVKEEKNQAAEPKVETAPVEKKEEKKEGEDKAKPEQAGDKK